MNSPYPLGIYLEVTKQMLLARGEEPDLPIPSFPLLNKKIWGIPKGKMTVIASRTSQGKTSLVLQMALDMLRQDKSVYYMSFEMTHKEIIERIFCNLYSVNNLDLLMGRFPDYFQMWDDFEQYITNKKFIISESFGKTWKELDNFIVSLKIKPDIIILDYIQAIAKSSTEGKGFIDEYIRHFREICITNNMAGIIVSQLNRQTVGETNSRPGLHNLKGSGFLEELADLVLLLEWQDKTKESFIINVAKNRSGRTGFIKMKYTPEWYKFNDIDFEELDEKEKYKRMVGK